MQIVWNDNEEWAELLCKRRKGRLSGMIMNNVLKFNVRKGRLSVKEEHSNCSKDLSSSTVSGSSDSRYNMRSCPIPAAPRGRSTGRKRPVVNYTKHGTQDMCTDRKTASATGKQKLSFC